jgi:hypothetical protein
MTNLNLRSPRQKRRKRKRRKRTTEFSTFQLAPLALKFVKPNVKNRSRKVY